jgi:DivIVA domain-containing protein
MVLTPADVHNVAFSRAPLGRRGYSEREVDIFVDLVEQELIRHIEQEAELRNRNAGLRKRGGIFQQREAELSEREAVLHQHEDEVRQHEDEVRQHEDEVRKHEDELHKHEIEVRKHEDQLRQQGALVHQRTPLPQQVAQLRYRESQVAQREAHEAQHEAQVAQREAEQVQQEAELAQWEAELRQREARLTEREAELSEQEAELVQWETELRQQQEEQHALVSGGAAAPNQVSRPYPAAQQLSAVPSPAAVNGASRLEEARAVASVHGRHHTERMAIRAVTDTLGNTVTETLHERTCRNPIGDGAPGVASEESSELDQLKQENAELARSLGLLKSAAALLAAALDRP